MGDHENPLKAVDEKLGVVVNAVSRPMSPSGRLQRGARAIDIEACLVRDIHSVGRQRRVKLGSVAAFDRPPQEALAESV